MQSLPGVRQTQNQASKRKVLQLGANPSIDCLNDKAWTLLWCIQLFQGHILAQHSSHGPYPPWVVTGHLAPTLFRPGYLAPYSRMRNIIFEACLFWLMA